jgi:probable rRNA maturation factor
MPHEISLVLVNDRGIRAINRQHLDHDTATDVISFRLPAMPGMEAGLTGEVVVNVERAVTRAPRAPERELALYIAHGCDHLADERDDEEAGRRQMRRRELRWLQDAHAAALIEGILERTGRDS